MRKAKQFRPYKTFWNTGKSCCSTNRYTSLPRDGSAFIEQQEDEQWYVYGTDEEGVVLLQSENPRVLAPSIHEPFKTLEDAQKWVETNVPPRAEMHWPWIYHVAWMVRWGTAASSHSYAVGVFTESEDAGWAGKEEEDYRGGKYTCQGTPCDLDVPPPWGKLRGTPKLAEHVYVAWVISKKMTKYEDPDSEIDNTERYHLLGVFSTKKRAQACAGELYPGWHFECQKFEVNKKGKE